jgi:two-component system, chemotaxis family, sensor kinase CheA
VSSREEEYRQLFLTEANENLEELNRLFVDIEKDQSNRQAINSIFRIIHTLKGNAMGMGYDAIADLSHTLEDIFGAIKERKINLTSELTESLFRANDKLGGLVKGIESGEKISFLGIKTKLSVYLKNAIADSADNNEEETKTSQEAEETVAVDSEDGSIRFSNVVQIPVQKMDDLLNLVGELVIERDRLISVYGEEGKSTLEFEGLKRISSNLHYGIMNVRMVQIGFLFNKFHRVLRDAAASEKKEVALVLKGTEVEIDRNILKIISDSIVHLVRNAVGHGVESKEERQNSGKSAQATVTLEAKHEKDTVILSVSDDGKGVNIERIREKIVEKKMVTKEVSMKLPENEIVRYIFEPGFSSADSVTSISGRGVGMDVVKKTVESIGGQVIVESEFGKGTSINLILPSSLALKGALLFEVQAYQYAIPLTYIESVIYVEKADIHKIANSYMINYKDQSILIWFLQDLLSSSHKSEMIMKGNKGESFSKIESNQQLSVIITNHSGRRLALVVDKLIRQKEIIEKKLSKPMDNSKLLSGTTILGTGNVCPVIDVASCMDLLYNSGESTNK